jgi:hypothetical protein
MDYNVFILISFGSHFLSIKLEMHSHPRSVAICLNDQQIKFTFPNGKTEKADLERGQTVWLDGRSHAVQNVGTEDISSVVVELKK